MNYKPRMKPAELTILEFLNARLELPQKSEQYYLNLVKGYEGELLFDSLTEKLQCDSLILNDLLLKENHTTFQMDSLIITSNMIYVYEVKNFDGDYYYDTSADKFSKNQRSEITNPLHQLARMESLLTKLLRKHGFNIPIQAFVVFINDEFTLYQSPLSKPIIHPTQVKRHLAQLDSIPTTLCRKQKQLADKLLSLHISESPYTQLPAYEYDQLKKGITCNECHAFSVYIKGRQCICKRCAHAEPATEAVMRSVREFQRLFPDRKVTTSTMQEWCQVVESKKVIRRVLNQNFKREGSNRWIYYT